MKIATIIFLLLTPILGIAQNFQDMTQEDMQKMMQQMQQAQACIQKVDQNELKALEQRSNQFQAEVKSLCDDGKRNEAQQKALAFGQEIVEDSTVQAVRKCSEMVTVGMPEMPYKDPEKYLAEHHVCDG